MFKEFDYTKYKPKPFYLPGNPNTDAQVAARKQQIEARLHKYKHYKDFDKISSVVGRQPRHLFTKYASTSFWMTFLFIPFMIHKHFGIFTTRKIIVLNLWKAFFTTGVIVGIVFKSDIAMRVFERNPYGTVSAPVNSYKKLSYTRDLYQDVKIIKQKYNDQRKSNFYDVLNSYGKRRSEKLYGHFVNYLRDYPQECMD